MFAPSENLVGQQLDDYRIEREIGRGGMGIVYAAQQVSLKRAVALKVLSANIGVTAQSLQRFRREAEAAAKLHHTNIVPVYGIGAQNGTHFYAMELIDGPSLDRVIERLRALRPDAASAPATSSAPPTSPMPPTSPTGPEIALTATGPYAPAKAQVIESGAQVDSGSLEPGGAYFDTVARMIAEVADALEHAHRQGVIHRDIKPSNLLLSAGGRLSINDFGLARVLEQPVLTQTGDMLGTPAYMSPEQITAGRIPLDQRTDIYSLGATLYELLTLERPFRGTGRDQVLAQIIHKEPVPPRKINKAVPLDLETICLKCLDKDPDRRYQSGQALADDLRRYVLRQAIQARRVGPIERLVKWCRRHPALAAALAGLLVAVTAAGYFAAKSSQSHRLFEEAESKRREDNRKNALDRALLEAMSANFRAAEVCLNDAIVNGASEGEVTLLRGQIELHAGRAEEAIQYLEKAVQLMPESVAARAIRRGAYRDAGRFDTYYTGIGETYRLQPQTAEDCLFVGQVLSGHYQPKRQVPLVDKAVQLRDSPIARLIRTEVLTRAATDTGLAADIHRALKEAEIVKSLLPTSPVATAVNIDAQVAAACFYEASGDEATRQEHLKQAKEEVDSLRDLPPFQRGVRARLAYFDVTGNDAAILEEFERVKNTSSVPIAARAAYLAHFRRGDYAQAVAILDRYPPTGDDTLHQVRRAFADSHLPGGLKRAEATLRAQRAARAGKRFDGRVDYYGGFIFLWLGRRDELVAELKQMEGSDNDDTRYLANQQADDEFLAKAGTSRWRQCEAHFCIGMAHLSRNDRAGAREHFEKTVATRIVGFLEYEFSRCFLTHMKRDKRWPGWIR